MRDLFSVIGLLLVGWLMRQYVHGMSAEGAAGVGAFFGMVVAFAYFRHLEGSRERGERG